MRRFQLVALMALTLVIFSRPPILLCQSSSDSSNQLWMAIRKQLSGTDGYQFFEEKIRNSKIPTFYGRVVSSSPEDNPETLMVAMSGSSNSEIRLNLNPRTENSVPSGSQIAFEGVAVGFTQEPFLLTLNVTAIRSSGGARNSL